MDLGKLLIVGGGESHKQHDFMKDFSGDIIATDVSAHELLDHNIKFKYVTWLETTDINVEWLVWSILHRLDDTILVYRRGKIDNIASEAAKYNVRVKAYSPPTYINNVGLMSIAFAQQVLHSKEIHLIGMEHRGEPYSEGWYGDMLGAYSRWVTEADPGCKMIDHSINGRLGI